MIKFISSSLPTFKSVRFHDGLNVLVAKKESSSTDKQTRNRAGKSSLVEIIHFLTGADCKADSIFKMGTLLEQDFYLDFLFKGSPVRVCRSGSEASKIRIESLDGKSKITNTEWLQDLGAAMFKLDTISKIESYKIPTFRSLFSYFARRSGGFSTPEKHATMQQIGDYQINLMYLLGLDWKIIGEWQAVRDKEKIVKALRNSPKSKSPKSDQSSPLYNKSDNNLSLRTELALKESRLAKLKKQLAEFKLLDQYREYETELNDIVKKISDLSNDNVIDDALIKEISTNLDAEAPPNTDELKKLYDEAGVVLSDVVLRRYEEVKSFHESIIKNREDYLRGELIDARNRINNREKEKVALENRSSYLFGILKSHGALDQQSKLQGDATRLEVEVERLRSQFSATEKLESSKQELAIERSQLELRLRRDFTEQKNLLTEAILAFESVSQDLYESAGSMEIIETANGPSFRFPIQGNRSKGIQNMQIFCFDMMLMKLCLAKGLGPGFLVHDSHLFDGVDGRQVISALKLGAKLSEEVGFQYIVTMNEDDAFKETIDNFDLKKYVLPVSLTDATEVGGLFGVRF